MWQEKLRKLLLSPLRICYHKFMNEGKYSLEKAQEEADILRKKVESGEVSGYVEAEKKLEDPNSTSRSSEYFEADFERSWQKIKEERLERNRNYWEKVPDQSYIQGHLERIFNLVPRYIEPEDKSAKSEVLREMEEVLKDPDKYPKDKVEKLKRYKQLREDAERIFATIDGSEDVLRILKEDYEGFVMEYRGQEVLVKLYIALRKLGYSDLEVTHPGENL